MLFNQCAYGVSQCAAIDEAREWIAATEAAVAWARDHGARRVTIVGASVGGIVALHAATSITPRVDAVVNLSGELRLSDLDSVAAAKRLDIAALFAIAPGDPYVTVDEMRTVFQAVSAAPKRLVVRPDRAGHGWEMLSDARGSGWSPLATTIASWIHVPIADPRHRRSGEPAQAGSAYRSHMGQAISRTPVHGCRNTPSLKPVSTSRWMFRFGITS